ncbi:MAG TPA: hypothetical protein VK283_05730 [Acidimicrobiales bacterium]|nr:hypothetical protein [Acidimicrobiales bacterium]
MAQARTGNLPGLGSDGTLLADEVAAWLRGEADMVTAAMGRRVPVAVQLGVLAHAPLDRLRDLGRYSRRGSVRRAWGTDMARLAGDIARCCGSQGDLARLQSDVLAPLELDVVAGRRVFSCREDAVTYVRDHVPLGGPDAGPGASAPQ